MVNFNLFLLLIVMCWSFYLTFELTSRYTTSVIIIFLKYILFFTLIYVFGFYFTPDSVRYYQKGWQIAQLHYHFVEMFIYGTPARQAAMAIANTQHLFYFLISAMVQYLFGHQIINLLLTNTLATFVCGYLLHRLMNLMRKYDGLQISEKNICYASIFFLFQPALISWTTFLTLKDIFVILLTLLFFNGIYEFKFNKIKGLVLIGAACFFLLDLRFYIIIALVASYALSRVKLNVKLIYAAPLLLVSFLAFHLLDISALIEKYAHFSIAKISYGFVRMMLTPLPWQVSSTYAFLTIPAIWNVLLFIPMCVGIWVAYKRKMNKMYMIFFFGVIFIYSLSSQEQGARYYFQLIWLTSFFQFLFFVHFLPRKVCPTKPS